MSVVLYTECLVLKKVNYKDKDAIYHLLSKDLGKISVFGKGIRSISSKRLALMDTLNLVKVGIHTNSNGHKTLAEVSLVNSFSQFKQPENFETLFYFLSIIHKGVSDGFEHDKKNNLRIFEYTKKALELFNTHKGESTMGFILDWFSVSFLKEVGYEIAVENCAICGTGIICNEGGFNFDSEHGGVVCDKCSKFKIIHSKESYTYLLGLKNSLNSINTYDSSISVLIKEYVKSKILL